MIIGLTVAACLPAHAIVLRYKPEVGVTTKCKASMSGRLHTVMESMGQTMQMEMTMTMQYSEKALATTEKGTKVETKLLSGEGTMSFDGQSQAIPVPTGRMVSVLDERGRVVELVEADFGDATMQQLMGSLVSVRGLP
jgi:hypothetical protein